MILDYNSYIAQIANLTAMDATTPEFQLMVQGMIPYAEKRLYREADFVNTVCKSDAILTKNDRLLVLPPAQFGSYITVQGINVLAYQQRVQLQPVATSFLNAVYGTPATAGVPQYFAMFTQDTAFLGPYPDSNYPCEIFGTFRPEPLSPTNPTTYLTEYLPDVFTAASMIFASGYMRDFGAQSDNPNQAQSWENQYQLLFKGANLESLRQKFAGPGWISLSAIPVADSR